MRNPLAAVRRVPILLILAFVLALNGAAQNSFDVQVKKRFSADESSGAARAVQEADAALDYKNEFAVWAGGAPDIPRLFSGSRRSSFGAVGFRYARRLATTRNLAIKYQIDLIPLAVLSYRVERLYRTSPNAFTYDRSRDTAYAAGLTPVSFQLNFRRRRKIQPFVTAGAGLLIFGKKIPDDRSPLRPDQVGRRLNFTPQGGGGVEFLSGDGEKSYTVGFKFHHISNNSTARINPGFDQNLFYFGYTFKKF